MRKLLGMIKNLFNVNITMLPVIEFKNHKPQFDYEIKTTPLQRSTPEEHGISSKMIIDYINDLQNEKSINMHSILILKNGKVINETAFGNCDLSVWKMTFSACKSVVSIAIGMLIDEGKLNLNTPIIEIFPEYSNPVNKIKLREITVKTLLTMSTGSTFNEFGCMVSHDWEKSFFKSAFAIKPGATFNYNSLNTYMLSAIINRVSGTTLTEYLKNRLFKPLGIENYHFEKSNSSVEKGGWGLYIVPEDFAKIGQMVLNRGLWDGQRIVSEEWINFATTKQISTPDSFGNFDYGYHFWTNDKNNSFLFNGMFGQNILGFYDSGVLIVSNAGNDELFQQSKFFEITERYFSCKFEKKIQKNKKANSKLTKLNKQLKNSHKKSFFYYISADIKANRFIKNFELLNARFSAKSSNAASVGLLPKLLQIIQNNYSSGFCSAMFIVKNKQLFLQYEELKSQFIIPIGITDYLRSEIDYYGEKYLIAAKIEKQDENYVINIDFIETFSSRKLVFERKKGGVILTHFEKPGMDLIRNSISLFKNTLPNNKLLAGAVNKVNNDFLLNKCHAIFEQSVELFEE